MRLFQSRKAVEITISETMANAELVDERTIKTNTLRKTPLRDLERAGSLVVEQLTAENKDDCSRHLKTKYGDMVASLVTLYILARLDDRGEHSSGFGAAAKI